MINTFEIIKWNGSFGDSYINRNYDLITNNKKQKESKGVTTEEIINGYFQNIDRKISIIELGCNVGINLGILKNMGFTNLYGLDINKKAIKIAQQNHPDITFINSSIENYDNNNKFDLVFTSYVLIHINPKLLNQVIHKIILLSNKFILGIECYADKLTHVNYRGNKNIFWKQDFLNLYLKTNRIRLIEAQKIYYKDKNLIDDTFLLKVVR